jgi:hypothetical protein
MGAGGWLGGSSGHLLGLVRVGELVEVVDRSLSGGCGPADLGEPFTGCCRWCGCVVVGGVAVDLVGVEDGIDTGDKATAEGFAVVVCLVVVLGGDPFDDVGGVFAFADLGAVGFPLFVGGPFAGGVGRVRGRRVRG